MKRSSNRLFPVFLKLEQLVTLVVGGGNVGLEKLQALLKNDPYAKVRLVATEVSPRIEKLARKHRSVQLVYRPFDSTDLDNGVDIVIIATDDARQNAMIRYVARAKGLLVNVADTPDLCDFYLGSTVTKGNLKVGISTNGQSPTFAKRFRQLLEDVLPDETGLLLKNLNKIRNRLKGDFKYKVTKLNEITSSFLEIKDN